MFENVTFAYPSNPAKAVLKDFSAVFKAGRFNAIAGFTGAGKSTLIELILKFYEPQSGTVRLAGRDLRTVSAQWVRARVGFVSQEPVLFSGSVEENVRVGKAGATEDEVRAALAQANVLSFVDSLPGGLAYDIGVGGCRLSGGQKQRIAIARALVKTPEILLLDEATSALDRATERVIQRTIENAVSAAGSRITVLCIAHRLKTIVNADCIYYMDEGRVLEKGRFS